MISECI